MLPRTYTSAREVRRAFWLDNPTASRRKIGNSSAAYTTDTQIAFCDYVDYLARSGMISERLAQSVTLD